MDLFTPVSWNDFVELHWHQNPLHVQRKTPGYYQDIFSEQDVDDLLIKATPATVREIIISKRVDSGGVSKFLQMGDDQTARRAYDEGFSVAIGGVDRCYPRLAAFKKGVEALLRQKMTCTAIVTPPEAQGFPPHWDGYDVFALQVAGSKLWTFHSPRVQFPLQKSAPLDMKGEEPVARYELIAGDTLYFPKGWIHQAETRGERSVHLTFWYHSMRWLNAIIEAVTLAAIEDVRLREDIPFHRYADRASLQQQVASIASDALMSADWQRALAKCEPITTEER